MKILNRKSMVVRAMDMSKAHKTVVMTATLMNTKQASPSSEVKPIETSAAVVRS